MPEGPELPVFAVAFTIPLIRYVEAESEDAAKEFIENEFARDPLDALQESMPVDGKDILRIESARELTDDELADLDFGDDEPGEPGDGDDE